MRWQSADKIEFEMPAQPNESWIEAQKRG